MISYFITVVYEYVNLIFVERFLYAERFSTSKSTKNDDCFIWAICVLPNYCLKAHFETKGGFQYIMLTVWDTL